MKPSSKPLFAALVALAAVPVPVMAQWPDYRAAGAPRTSDGKVNLNGPTPKASDGHPDLSGIWNFRGPVLGRGGGDRPPAPPPGTPPSATFRDIGAGFKEGLPFWPLAAQLVKARRAENSKDNPDARCLPLGLMQLHTHPQPRKMIQTPGLMVILYEAQSGVRQIFTDGRSLPGKDAEPWWYNYSVGKWEGDTLVVETTGFRDDVWLDIIGSPLTSLGKMTERFRRPTFGTLEIDVTFEDPTVYSKPFTVRVNQRLMPDTDLIEFICNENNRSDPHLVGK
jgi:hypothetical protein